MSNGHVFPKVQNTLRVLLPVGTASAASPIPQHLCIFTLMASHAVINLCPQHACSYPLFHFTTTWYYSLTLHCFLYHHFYMIPWLRDSALSLFLYILLYSFLAPQTLYHIRVWHLRWATLYTWCFILYHINYVPVAIIFTGEYNLDIVPHSSATSELSYLQILLRSFCV